MASVKAVVLLLLVSLAVSQAAVFGIGNIMYQRYPNGPEDMYNMGAPVVETRSAGNPFRPGRSWLPRRGGHPPVIRRYYS